MTRFRVWAPLANRVQLALGDVRHPMQAAEHGWWSAHLPPGGAADTDYAFVVDESALVALRSMIERAQTSGASRCSRRCTVTTAVVTV